MMVQYQSFSSAIITLLIFSTAPNPSFSFTATSKKLSFVGHTNSLSRRTILRSTPLLPGDDDDLGFNLQNPLSVSEMSKQRSDYAREQALAGYKAEEEAAEAKRLEKKAMGDRNVGPGDDLSAFSSAVDDGFEASEGNDTDGGWDPNVSPGATQESDNAQSTGTVDGGSGLYIPGADNNSSDGGLLL